MSLSQNLQQKLLQKLSPQQIQLMKLLQVPTANLEERIKEEFFFTDESHVLIVEILRQYPDINFFHCSIRRCHQMQLGRGFRRI